MSIFSRSLVDMFKFIIVFSPDAKGAIKIKHLTFLRDEICIEGTEPSENPILILR